MKLEFLLTADIIDTTTRESVRLDQKELDKVQYDLETYLLNYDPLTLGTRALTLVNLKLG